jgi:hypothetical protein
MAFERHCLTLHEAKAIKMASTQLLAEAAAEEKRILEEKPLHRINLAIKQVTARFKIALSSPS